MQQPMQTLTNKMRTLAIQSLKERREQIFDRTRKLINQEIDSSQESQTDEVEKEQENKIKMEEQEQYVQNDRRKKRGRHSRHTHSDYKTKRYWRRMLQVSDWLVSIPPNLNDFYLGLISQGSKCLMIMKYNSIQLCDKAGNLVLQLPWTNKAYNGTILQVYLCEEAKSIVISDMIVWKGNPMTGSQFEFRIAWLQSNLSLASLKQQNQYTINFMMFWPLNSYSLKLAYEGQSPYPKQGLLLIHKDSAYEHGLNPNVLIWKDDKISPYFRSEMQDNKMISKGVGYINKDGEVRSVQNVKLFVLDRSKFDLTHKFAKFTYRSVHLLQCEQENVTVQLEDLMLTETARNHYGPVDSLGKLFFKSSIKNGAISFDQLLSFTDKTMISE